MKTLKTVTIEGLEILRAGRWNGRTYTVADLDALSESYTALHAAGAHEAPGKLGHNDAQAMTDGQPAAGWATKVYRKGNVLLADFKEVPAKVAELIKAGAYKKRSSEIMFNSEINGTVWPLVLRAVAWLGTDTPAVKGLDDIFEMYKDADGNEVAVVTMTDEASFDSIRTAVWAKLNEVYPYQLDEYGYPSTSADDSPSPSIRDLFTDSVVVWNQLSDGLWRLPYSIDTALTAVLGEPEKVRIEYVSVPQQSLSVKDGAHYIVMFKDDEEAKNPSDLMGEMKALIKTLDSQASGKKGVVAARTYLKEVLKKLGEMGFADMALNSAANDATEATEDMEETKIRKLLGIDGDADIEAAIQTLTTGTAKLSDDHAATLERLTVLETERKQERATVAVDAAIRAAKLAPAQREWATTYYLSDAEGFAKFVEMAPKVVLLGELGKADATAESAQVSDSAKEIAKRMGISEARLSESRSFAERLAEATAAR